MTGGRVTTQIVSTPSAEVLLASPIFRDCDAGLMTSLIPHVREQELVAGQTLVTRDDKAHSSYLLINGALRCDDERIINESGAMLGEEAGLGLPRYSHSVTAVEATRVLLIPRTALDKLATADRAFRLRLMCSYSGQRVDPPAPPEEHRTSHWQSLGWLLALVIPALTYYTLHDAIGKENPAGLYFLAIGSAAIVMWVFQLLPEFVPALFALLAVILLGVSPPAVAMSGFASKGFVIALSIFGLSVVIRSSGLSYRILLWLLKVGPASKVWYNISLFITGLALTPVIPSTNGRVAIIAPLLKDLLQSIENGSVQEKKRIAVTALAGVSMLSAVFLSSKSINFVVFGFLPTQEQARFQWLYWAYAGSVVGLAMLVFFIVIAVLFYRNREKVQISKSIIDIQLKVLGPLSRGEWAALFGLILLGVSVVTTAIHHIEVPWVAMAILFWLLMFGFLDRNEFRERIDWTFLVFLGALIGMVAVMRDVGMDEWLASQLGGLGRHMSDNFTLFVALLALTIFLIRQALPINATVVVLAAVLMPYASAVGVNPWLIGFLILFFSESFLFPYQASYYLLFTSSTQLATPASDSRVVWVNLSIFLAKLASVYVSMPFWRQLGIL